MRELTNEGGVIIDTREESPTKRIVYLREATGERWAEIGVCNQCGLCEIGSTREATLNWDPTKKRGEAMSCSDPEYGRRRDIVNTPALKAQMVRMAAKLGIEGGGCSYTFEIL